MDVLFFKKDGVPRELVPDAMMLEVLHRGAAAELEQLRKKGPPKQKYLDVAPLLDDYYIEFVEKAVLVGVRDGEEFMTQDLVAFSHDLQIALTLDNWYRLGRQRSEMDRFAAYRARRGW
ncbi:hypothetical protein [Mycoplana dimorpha]|uniref:Uncharacterized protein n=1 Tax=Mycoplana dimorpha TaxID=28320 RepID=A0A2T5ANU9_MYCDI|nr:hypothetical protein [Mycoplana dimorpha]PTM88380.1 hypothetical protein C7449_11212 [Mycoplana dimorpha]